MVTYEDNFIRNFTDSFKRRAYFRTTPSLYKPHAIIMHVKKKKQRVINYNAVFLLLKDLVLGL